MNDFYLFEVVKRDSKDVVIGYNVRVESPIVRRKLARSIAEEHGKLSEVYIREKYCVNNQEKSVKDYYFEQE